MENRPTHTHTHQLCAFKFNKLQKLKFISWKFVWRWWFIQITLFYLPHSISIQCLKRLNAITWKKDRQQREEREGGCRKSNATNRFEQFNRISVSIAILDKLHSFGKASNIANAFTQKSQSTFFRAIWNADSTICT